MIGLPRSFERPGGGVTVPESQAALVQRAAEAAIARNPPATR